MRLQDRLKRKDMYQADPRLLKVDPGWNARVDTPELRAHIDQLKESIRTLGVLEPIAIYSRGDDIMVTNGHCRLAAVQALIDEGVEIETVPVRIEERGTNDADRTASMLTRNMGRRLTPRETADVIKRLIAYGWDDHQIASKTGMTVAQIRWHLDLLETPQEVLDMVGRGEVSATLAVKVVKEHPTEAPGILREAAEIATAAGKGKVSPKHVKAAHGARQDPAPAGGRKRVEWGSVGPKLRDLVRDAITATDPAKALQRLSDFFEATFQA